MTAIAPAAGHERQKPTGQVPWRLLTGTAVRQHRAVLGAYLILAGLLALAMAVAGLVLHPWGHRLLEASPGSPWHLFDTADTTFRLVLTLMPVLAGVFFGAPLVAREIETGTARFAWSQGAGRARWLVATVIPAAVLLAIVAAGLGLEHRWWLSPLLDRGWPWRSTLFGLNPLPYAGWMVLGFSLAVFLGGAIRRTVPAMAATLACYFPLMFATATAWRHDYLPPLHRRGVQPRFWTGGGYSYGGYFGGRRGPGPDVLSTALGWPDGRLLSAAELHHRAAWFSVHDIQVWITYQPGSRLATFHLIEFGWLIALSALLIVVTAVLTSRRAA